MKQVLDVDAAVREAELRIEEALLENSMVIAQRLLAKGMNKEEVAKITDLTMEQIEALSF